MRCFDHADDRIGIGTHEPLQGLVDVSRGAQRRRGLKDGDIFGLVPLGFLEIANGMLDHREGRRIVGGQFRRADERYLQAACPADINDLLAVGRKDRA